MELLGMVLVNDHLSRLQCIAIMFTETLGKLI